MKIAFRPYKGDDREEALESEAAQKALQAILGDRIEIVGEFPADVTHAFGRKPENWWPLPKDQAYPGPEQRATPYWEWEAFQAHARRSVTLCDLESAGERTAEIHAAGKDAFAKSTYKFWSGVIRQGKTFSRSIGELAFSFMDRAPCLLVQEKVEIRFEYRIFVVDGRPVTGAGAIMEHTPNDNEDTFDPKVREHIGGDDVTADPELAARYVAFAERVAPLMPYGTFDMDVALIDGEIGIVEVNPLDFGQVGLFACDADALALAIATSLKLT